MFLNGDLGKRLPLVFDDPLGLQPPHPSQAGFGRKLSEESCRNFIYRGRGDWDDVKSKQVKIYGGIFETNP